MEIKKFRSSIDIFKIINSVFIILISEIKLILHMHLRETSLQENASKEMCIRSQ